MHDFSCKDADDIHYDVLKKGVRHFKEEGGREIMCKAVEEYGKQQAMEATMEATISYISNLMDTLKISAIQAMDAMKISKEEQLIILGKLQQ